jgi:hypothetical protein
LELGTPIVDATYDPILGYPVQVAIGPPHPDTMVVYQASDFSPDAQTNARARGDTDEVLAP